MYQLFHKLYTSREFFINRKTQFSENFSHTFSCLFVSAAELLEPRRAWIVKRFIFPQRLIRCNIANLLDRELYLFFTRDEQIAPAGQSDLQQRWKQMSPRLSSQFRSDCALLSAHTYIWRRGNDEFDGAASQIARAAAHSAARTTSCDIAVMWQLNNVLMTPPLSTLRRAAWRRSPRVITLVCTSRLWVGAGSIGRALTHVMTEPRTRNNATIHGMPPIDSLDVVATGSYNSRNISSSGLRTLTFSCT